jgi:transposase
LVDTSPYLITEVFIMKRAAKTAKDIPTIVKRSRRVFTEDFKRDALDLAARRRREGVTWAQIGRELDLRPGLLYQWTHDRERSTPRGDDESPTGLAGETLEQEVRRLRRENAILREEREFAKKAAAFFATGSR